MMDYEAIGREVSKPELSRRDLMRMTGAIGFALSGIVFSGSVAAQGVHGFRNRVKRYRKYKNENPEPSPSWLEGILPKAKNKVDPAAIKHPGLFQAATECLNIGAKTRIYSMNAIEKGDPALAPCLKTIEAMIPVCNALAKLAELNAGRLKELARIAQGFVGDCEVECRKQVAAHPALQPCANACVHCGLEIKALLRA